MVTLLVILIGKSLFTPIGWIVGGASNILGESIIMGYQTMDGLAALAFTALVIQDAKFSGLKSSKQ